MPAPNSTTRSEAAIPASAARRDARPSSRGCAVRALYRVGARHATARARNTITVVIGVADQPEASGCPPNIAPTCRLTFARDGTAARHRARVVGPWLGGADTRARWTEPEPMVIEARSRSCRTRHAPGSRRRHRDRSPRAGVRSRRIRRGRGRRQRHRARGTACRGRSRGSPDRGAPRRVHRSPARRRAVSITSWRGTSSTTATPTSYAPHSPSAPACCAPTGPRS